MNGYPGAEPAVAPPSFWNSASSAVVRFCSGLLLPSTCSLPSKSIKLLLYEELRNDSVGMCDGRVRRRRIGGADAGERAESAQRDRERPPGRRTVRAVLRTDEQDLRQPVGSLQHGRPVSAARRRGDLAQVGRAPKGLTSRRWRSPR